MNDFWRMIWEQNTATIVMVTNLKERKEVGEKEGRAGEGCQQVCSGRWKVQNFADRKFIKTIDTTAYST